MYNNARGPGQLTSTDWALMLTDCLLSPNQSARYFINIFAGIFFIYSELQWFTIRIGRQIESLKCRLKHQLTILERTRTLFQTTQDTWSSGSHQYLNSEVSFISSWPKPSEDWCSRKIAMFTFHSPYISFRFLSYITSSQKNSNFYFSFSLYFFQTSELYYSILAESYVLNTALVLFSFTN